MYLKATRQPNDKNRLLTVGMRIIILALLVTLTDHVAGAAAETKIATSENVLKEKPIVIQTQVQGYDQPTLDEYNQCHENRDYCLKVCETAEKRSACEEECPTCPILISQDVVVQGINDTNYRLPAAAAPVNATNIIRLTNEIRNIIDNQMGNITARNENNINVYQNISTVGGDYGLGYNNNGSCCIVVRRGKNCDAQRFSTASRCHHKRHRVCGQRCKARVMYAKRVTHCEGTNDGLKAGGDSSNCQQSVEYVPYQRRRRNTGGKCHYAQQWPFVSCRRQPQRMSTQHCRQCLELPYGYILQHGISPRCMSCYSAVRSPAQVSYMPPNYATDWQMWPPYYPSELPYPPPYYGNVGGGGDNFDWMDEDFLPGGRNAGGWKIEKTKCRRPDGSIVENCHNNNDNNNIEGSGDNDFHIDATDPLAQLPETQDDSFNYDDDEMDADDYDEYFNAGGVRRRRRAFLRSAYSRRNKRKTF